MINHEKILKRPDGFRVKIVVQFVEYRYGEREYKTNVMICRPKKRKFVEFIHGEYLNYVTESEILEAKRELWKKMEPK